MQGGRCFRLLVMLLLICTASLLTAQSVRFIVPDAGGRLRTALPAPVRGPLFPQPGNIPQNDFGLWHLTRVSGMIFSGTVTAISRKQAANNQSLESVAITFRVENAIRGTIPGERLTITQWIGLWSSGQRYRVGERVLLFLYPRSKLGLTSCVGASLGRFGIDATGRVLLSSQQLSAFLRDPVLGGKSRLRIRDFALAVRQASEEE
jgi:hypothetical protein